MADAAWQDLEPIVQGLPESEYQGSFGLMEILDSWFEAIELANDLVLEPEREAVTEVLWNWAEKHRDGVKRLKLRRLHSYLVDLDHHEITPAVSSASSSWSQLLVKPPDAKRFSTSLQAHLAKKDLGPREKEDLQAKERSRWLTTLAQQLHDAGFLINAELAGHSDPVRVLANVFGAKRYRTLRARSRQWAKITNWMRHVHGKTWTTEILELVDLGEDFF